MEQGTTCKGVLFIMYVMWCGGDYYIIKVWMDGWMYGWMDGWMDGWVGGWVFQALVAWIFSLANQSINNRS
jgi:hypothetical protein